MSISDKIVLHPHAKRELDKIPIQFRTIDLPMKKLIPLLIAIVVSSGCATETPPKYNPSTGTSQKTYTTGELGSHFVKDLLGVGKD